MSTYSVTSLDDLANGLQQLADDQRASLKYQRTLKDKAIIRAKAEGLEQAAAIVRNTTITPE